jgi:hypothetical protein
MQRLLNGSDDDSDEDESDEEDEDEDDEGEAGGERRGEPAVTGRARWGCTS